MDDIDGQRANTTQIECPLCHAEGVVTSGGYAARLIYQPDLDPPFRCLAAHGALSHDDLVTAGVDPRLVERAGQPNGVDEESRERWEDESPAATRVSEGVEAGPTPLA